MSRTAVRRAHAALTTLVVLSLMAACGETRRPIGDECLRSDDCLSGVCSARTCVAAPALVNAAVGTPPDEMPLVPIVDGGASDAAVADAKEGG